MLNVVVFLVSLGVRVIRAMCRRRADLVLENVALRQQVTALKKERPRPVWSKYSNAHRVSSLHLSNGKPHEYFDLTGSRAATAGRDPVMSKNTNGLKTRGDNACAFYLFIRAHRTC